MFGIFGKRITDRGRDSVVLLGMLVHFVTFFLTLLNLPDKSPNDASHDMGYLFHPKYVCYKRNVYVFISLIHTLPCHVMAYHNHVMLYHTMPCNMI